MAAVKKSAVMKKASSPRDSLGVFQALRDVFADALPKLQALKDNDKEYTLHTRVPSPMKQHKGAPMFFSSVRNGKAYVSFHLFPLYMNAELTDTLSPELKKHMQGKTCFNFKRMPAPELIIELRKLTQAGLEDFEERGWA